jgi:hypothetical protein
VTRTDLDKRRDETGGGEPARDRGALDSHFVHPAKVWIVEAMQWIGRPLSAAELEVVCEGELCKAALAYHVNSLAAAGAVTAGPGAVNRGLRH